MSLVRSLLRLRKRNRKLPPIRDRIHFEPLEPRILLSSDLTYAAAAGTAVDLTLRLNDATQELQLIDNANQSTLKSQALTDTSAVEITGSDLDDKFKIELDFDAFGDSFLLNFDGGSGNDKLTGPDSDNTWEITGSDAGTLNDHLIFADIENLVGGSRNNNFLFEDGASISGTIDGAVGGINTIDYSACTMDVNVDLSEGTATGTGGIANIRNVIGGSGNDSLIGDDFDNELTGGAGLNILAGGSGNDLYMIQGNWQENTIVEKEDEGRDTLDFSDVTNDLNITIDPDANIAIADGSGHSLVPLDIAIPGESEGSLNFGSNWRASTNIGGSPGQDDI